MMAERGPGAGARPWLDRQAALSGTIEAVLSPLLRGRSDHICIIDPPGHPNVGDCAILLGELAFLRRSFPGSRLSFYDVNSYSPGADRFIEDATILLIHGGGNFGDIWPEHHGFRKTILSRFAHKAIVQLPQSIHFDDEGERQATGDLIRKVADFTLLVRDEASESYARTHFSCPVLLCPDMAFAMEPIRRAPGSLDVLCLLRQDKESILDRDAVAAAIARQGHSVRLDDWLGGPRSIVERFDNKLKRLTRRAPAATSPLRSVAMRIREGYARDRLAYGIAKLSEAEVVVTDRLHVHVLCCLLGIGHGIFDSYDGKVSALYRTWTEGFPGATMAATPDDLVRTAGRLLGRPAAPAA